jgi:multidrug efflux system membrane fusion protein
MNDLPPTSAPPPREPRDRPARRWAYPMVIVAMLIGMGVAAYFMFFRAEAPADAKGKAGSGQEGKAAKGKGAGKGGRFGGDPNRVQPVAVATARVGDIDIVQTALGTVTAGKVVTVKPRVDGQLASVAFQEGQMVKEGQVLAQIDPVPFQVALAQVEGNLARDAAQLNNARLDLERYRTLLQQDSIAAQQVDQQAALVRQLEGTVKIGQAQVDNARLQLSYTRITAPISGRVGLRPVDAGNMVRGSDTAGVAVITQLDPIGVLFTIPQDTLPRVLARLNTGERIPVDAWDRDQKNLLVQGALVTTDNQIDVATGTVRLKATFPNKEGKLFPNQFVNVRMVVDVRRGVVLVPTAAVQGGNQGPVVYVVRDDSTVALRQVKLGPAEGMNTVIESGLQAGERVIVDGVDRIREGVKVEVTQPGQRAGPGGGGAGGEGKGRRQRGEQAPGAGDPAKAAPEGTKGSAPKPGEAAKVTPAGPATAPSRGDADREAFRKSLEGMSPEERREAIKKRMDAMTPEEREAWKKRRAEREAAPQ